MKKLLTILTAVALAATCVVSCDDENPVRNYPRVVTDSVTDITAQGVVFNGSIQAADLASITDHGFVWSPEKHATIEDGFVIRLGAPASGQFTSGIHARLVTGHQYLVRAFAKSGSTVSYGKTVSFISLGSEGPSVSSITPATARSNETITISGKFFSDKIGENVVHFIDPDRTQPVVATLISSTSSELVVKVPEMFVRNPAIRVMVTGNLPITSPEKFTITLPEITGLAPTAAVCDPIEIYGKDLNRFPCNVYVGNIKVTPTEIRADKIVVPRNGAFSNSIAVKVEWLKNSLVQLTEDKTLQNVMILPKITSISPTEIRPGDVVTITGTNFPACPGLTVVGEKNGYMTFSIVTVTPTEIKAQLTKVDCAHPVSDPIALALQSRTIYTSTTTISVTGFFEVDLVTPTSAYYESVFKIHGRGLNDSRVFLKTDGEPQYYQLNATVHSSELIVVQQFSDLGDFAADGIEVKLVVEKCDLGHETPFIFHTSPLVQDIQPRVLTDLTTDVRITGLGFQSDMPGNPVVNLVNLSGDQAFEIPLKYVSYDLYIIDTSYLAVLGVPNGEYTVTIESRGKFVDAPQKLVISIP